MLGKYQRAKKGKTAGGGHAAAKAKEKIRAFTLYCPKASQNVNKKTHPSALHRGQAEGPSFKVLQSPFTAGQPQNGAERAGTPLIIPENC